MISALQGAKLKAANVLRDSRNNLLDARSLICFEPADVRVIDDLVGHIDKLFATFISNTKENDEGEES